jgi:hypothetical protein
MFAFLTLGRAKALLLVIGIAAGILAWAIFAGTTSKRAAPIDPTRSKAWEKIASRLQRADQQGAELCEKQLQRVRDFFNDKRGHVHDFADDALGWGAKWAFVKGKLIADEGKGHQAHLRQCFEQHIFSDRDMGDLLSAVIIGYLSELEGEENALLVEIQTDLSEQELPALRALATQNSSEAFRGEYRKLVNQVTPIVGRDIKIAVAREAIVWVGSDIAAAVAVRIASAVAVRLGVSGGILGSGAASGAATLGIGLVAGFVVDAAVDWIMRQHGYDPAGDIARELSATLVRIEGLVVDGEPQAHGVFNRLRHLQEHDRFPFVRAQCAQSADRMSGGGALGLRHEMSRLRQLRSALRQEALKRLVLEGGTP